MKNDLQDFEHFMKKQRDEAARAFANGDAGPLGRIVARGSSATFFGPGGGHREGADEVYSKYKEDAEHFTSGGESSFEILQMGANDGIAYWVGIQHGKVHPKGSKEAATVDIRVTEVFRREQDAWKLVHRHADTLASESKKK